MMRPIMLDYAVEAAAERVLHASLALRHGERLLIIVDRANGARGDAFGRAATEVGAHPTTLVLEDLAPRPQARLHGSILEALSKCDAAVLSIESVVGEASARRTLWDAVCRGGRVRYAHSVGTSNESFIAGTSIDSRRLAELAASIRQRMRPTSLLRVTSRAGTDVTLRVSSRYRWREDSGIASPGAPTQLPAGELFTHPETVDGVYVVEGSVMTDSGSLPDAGQPGALRFDIKGGHVVRVRSPRFGVQLESLMRQHTDLDRVGVVCIGTNTGLLSPSGVFGIDQKMPGAHIVLGETFRDVTGATWSSGSLIGATCTHCDIDVDGTPLLRGGRYVI
jgi:leucyl aminopeptidase (aminopeptidase T)